MAPPLPNDNFYSAKSGGGGVGGGGIRPAPPEPPFPLSLNPKMILHNRGHVCMMINLTCEHLNLVRLLEDFNDVKCD